LWARHRIIPTRPAFKNDLNNIGPAVGFSWNLPFFGEGKTTIRGGYQVTFGGSGRLVGGGGATSSEVVIGGAPERCLRRTRCYRIFRRWLMGVGH
jgi:hypothetical protein